MPFTNKTPNYDFPQWSGTDYPSFVKDMNPAYLTLDTQIKALNDSVTSAASAAQAAAQAAQAAQQAAQAAQQAADNAVNLLVDLGVTDEETALAFKSKVDNAVPKYAILASYFDTQS